MRIWNKKGFVFAAACLASMAIDYQASANSGNNSEAKMVEGDYRRMHHALDNLRAARIELLASEHNHGGWRERAILATDNAIHETENAMNWR
ncbi:MAG TPA: hypothetical protein VGH28_24180 [Polyangiaceae bacterium]|jgi:hypothetical protein